MRLPQVLLHVIQPRFRAGRPASRTGRRRLRLESLESRQLMAADLILDFDGATLSSGNGYALPEEGDFSGFAFSGFTPFNRADGSPGNAEEQILQILAGVREDFARFDVNVIWDNAGVGSAFYDAQDTVLLIVNHTLDELTGLQEDFDTDGLASSVDVNQGTTAGPMVGKRDTAYAFLPLHVGVGDGFARNELRELIDTISHEAGHTFGLSHATTTDAEQRQIVTTADQNKEFDSIFSNTVLLHDDPEAGAMYSEVARLNATVGPAASVPVDVRTGQTLPADTRTGTLTPGTPLGGQSINFAGDRDAYRFTATESGELILRQRSTSTLVPFVSLWDVNGDFIAAGGGGSATTGMLNRDSMIAEISFNAIAGQTYYAVAGSQADRSAGRITTPNLGTFELSVSPPMPPATISIASTGGNAAEGNVGSTPRTFNVTRTVNTTGTTTVNFAVSGTGTNPATASDFVGNGLPSGTVTFLNDEIIKTITIDIVGDILVEMDESFLVALSGASDGATIGTATAMAIIENDDAPVDISPPTVSAIADVTLTVGQSAAPIVLNLGDDRTAADDLMVSVTSSNPAVIPTPMILGLGAERTLRLTPIVNAAGVSTITVRVADAAGNESSRTFQVRVNNPTITSRILAPPEVVRLHVIPGGGIPTAILANARLDTVMTVARADGGSLAGVQILDANRAAIQVAGEGGMEAALSRGSSYAILFPATTDPVGLFDHGIGWFRCFVTFREHQFVATDGHQW